jgi:hypothetical protein
MFPITAGIFIRRYVRRFLILNNIEFKEDKGLIDSVFIVKCDYEKYNLIVKDLNDGLNN